MIASECSTIKPHDDDNNNGDGDDDDASDIVCLEYDVTTSYSVSSVNKHRSAVMMQYLHGCLSGCFCLLC